jgi:hypothetical protein
LKGSKGVVSPELKKLINKQFRQRDALEKTRKDIRKHLNIDNHYNSDSFTYWTYKHSFAVVNDRLLIFDIGYLDSKKDKDYIIFSGIKKFDGYIIAGTSTNKMNKIIRLRKEEFSGEFEHLSGYLDFEYKNDRFKNVVYIIDESKRDDNILLELPHSRFSKISLDGLYDSIILARERLQDDKTKGKKK